MTQLTHTHRMNIAGSTVLITGANRGLGAVFLEQALERGASKIYAASRTPGTWSDPRVVSLRIDVTDEQTILEAAHTATDVTLLINNAGIANHAPLASGDIAAIRADMDTNFWGPILMTRAFAPVLAAQGGGTVLNVLLGAGRYEVIVDDTGRDMKRLLALAPEDIPAAFGGLQV